MIYKNGNTTVILCSDGTKIRHIPTGEVPKPCFPESIDVKITDKCKNACPFCYERSTVDGKHGNLNHPIFDSLQAGTELAIGGGNPLEHPDLEPFLRRMKRHGVVCNLTVELRDYCQFKRYINALRQNILIFGLGISAGSSVIRRRWYEIAEVPADAIIHTIIGITPESVIFDLMNHYKILFLGNKTGEPNKESVDAIRDYISDNQETIDGFYFDNLACEQLGIQLLVPADKWRQCYMGNDGTFTMFIDLVRETGHVSSITDREKGVPLSDAADISTLFQKVITQ